LRRFSGVAEGLAGLALVVMPFAHGLNAFLGVLSGVVAWGRFGPYHF
jgi:hypothetical protein